MSQINNINQNNPEEKDKLFSTNILDKLGNTIDGTIILNEPNSNGDLNKNSLNDNIISKSPISNINNLPNSHNRKSDENSYEIINDNCIIFYQNNEKVLKKGEIFIHNIDMNNETEFTFQNKQNKQLYVSKEISKNISKEQSLDVFNLPIQESKYINNNSNKIEKIPNPQLANQGPLMNGVHLNPSNNKNNTNSPAKNEIKSPNLNFNSDIITNKHNVKFKLNPNSKPNESIIPLKSQENNQIMPKLSNFNLEKDKKIKEEDSGRILSPIFENKSTASLILQGSDNENNLNLQDYDLKILNNPTVKSDNFQVN